METLSCSDCKVNLSDPLYCFQCEHIQVHTELPDYFTLLSLPKEYSLNKEKLESNLEKWMLLFHPDLHLQKSEKQQSASLQYSALINQAKNTLLDPYQRAIYLLQLLGYKLDESRMHPSQEFLIEMFELQEKIEELQINHIKNSKLFETIEQYFQDTEKKITRCFEQLQIHQNAPNILQELYQYLGKFKFIINLKKEGHKLQ